MVKERVSSKANRKRVCSSQKNGNGVLDRNKINMEESLIPELLMKQLFYSGLLDIK